MNKLYSYPVFESDQVLTEKDLNNAVDFLAKQDLLTRSKVIGIGIVCGLEAKSDGSTTVQISKGAGITSEGHLLYLEEKVYKRYRPYTEDKATKSYEYLKNGDSLFNLNELITDEEYVELEDDGDIEAIDSAILANKAVILYLEIEDKDLQSCIGEDCLEKGISRIYRIRPLLISKEDLKKVIAKGTDKETVTESELQEELNRNHKFVPLAVERLQVNPPDNSRLNLEQIFDLNAFTNAYRDIFKQAVPRIGKALAGSYNIFEHELKGQYNGSNPFAGFEKDTLTQNPLYKIIDDAVKKNDLSVQYAYDFLHDLILAYREFADTGAAYSAECCASADLFPLHLMLGTVAATEEKSIYRHYFMPSQVIASNNKSLERLKFLHRKMVLMVENFQIEFYTKKDEIKITPSVVEHNPLSKRSIPFYYNLSDKKLQHNWSFTHNQRNSAATILSYFSNGNSDSEKKFTKHPLLFGFDQYPFFRIEGHIGQDYKQVKNYLEKMVTDYNLSFEVKGVKLSRDYEDVEVKDACIEDLQILYSLEREELLCRLKNLQTQLEFVLKYLKALIDNQPQNPQTNYAPNTYLQNLNGYYSLFQMFLHQVKQSQKNLTEKLHKFNPDKFSISIQKVAYYSAYLRLIFQFMDISNNDNPQLKIFKFLGLLLSQGLEKLSDKCIEVPFLNIYARYEERIEKLQLAKLFPYLHNSLPGFEHLAGVKEGGTFILVYDDVPEEPQEEPEEPEPETPEEEDCYKNEDDKGLENEIMYKAMHKDKLYEEFQEHGEFFNMYYTERAGADELYENRERINKIEETDPLQSQVKSSYKGKFAGKFTKPAAKKYRVVADFALPYRCCDCDEQEKKTIVEILLPKNEFCKRDKEAGHLITVKPEGGKIYGPEGTVITKEGKSYFVPSAATTETVELVYLHKDGHAQITVKVYNPIAAFEVERIVENDRHVILLKNTSTGADNYEWQVEETGEMSTDEDFRIFKTGSDFNTLNVTLTAKRGDCSSTYSEEIPLREVETEFSLDRHKWFPEKNIYCNNDPEKYQFHTQPEGKPEGDPITKEGEQFYFKPLNLEAGEYKFKHHDKEIVAEVRHVPDVDFRYKAKRNDNAILVTFFYTGENKNGKISWDYGDGNNDPHMPIDEPVTNHYFTNSNIRKYKVNMSVIFESGCANTVEKEIDIDVLLRQLESGKGGKTVLEYDVIILEESGKNIINKYEYTGLNTYRETTDTVNKWLQDPESSKEILSGKMNEDLAGTYKKMLDETSAKAMEAAENNDTKAADYFAKSYLVQLEGLVETINMQEKDLKKSDPLAKVLAETPKTLEKFNTNKIDVPTKDLEVVVAVHRKEAGGKKNFTKELNNLTKAVK